MLTLKALRRQRGYSLAEMLVVVAIIGMFSLITIPSIVQYSRQMRVRTATRQLNSDLRFARQRAIAQGEMVAFCFVPGDVDADVGMEKGRYALYDRVVDTSTDPDTISWTQLGPPRFLEGVYFLPSNFSLTSAIDDNQHDVIFRPNGTVNNMPGTPPGLVEIRTERDFRNNHVTNRFFVSGSFTTTLTTD